MEKLKLKILRKLRAFLVYLEYVSQKWVIPNENELCLLIENTSNPDFEKYFSEVEKLRKRWKIHDSSIESLAVRGRLMQFKFERVAKSDRR